MSQDTLADKLHCNRDTVSDWETDRHIPDRHALDKLIAPLDLRLADKKIVRELWRQSLERQRRARKQARARTPEPDRNSPTLGSQLDYEQMARRERSAEEVWVFAKVFSWDLEHDLWGIDVIEPNLLEGTRYHYVFPESQRSEATRLAQRYARFVGNGLLLTSAKESSFDGIVEQIVIFDPLSPRAEGFYVDPIVSETVDIQMSPEQLVRFRQRFHQLILDSPRFVP